MITQPLNDARCLLLVLAVAREHIRESEVQTVARAYASPSAYVDDLRSRPQLDDRAWILPRAPRIPCHPPQRVRFNPKDPNCVERALSYIVVAEILDPDTPRTLFTVRYGVTSHTLPVEQTTNGPQPVILDPHESTTDTLPANLSFAAVAQLLGYAPGQPTPTTEPLAWAEQIAAREGPEPRNGRKLYAVAERYASAYLGGRQGLADLAGQLLNPVVDGAKEIIETGAREVKKRPRLGQMLRTAVLGYGGPAAVVAIDVLEKRLNKRGYTLGSLAESRDADVFSFE